MEFSKKIYVTPSLKDADTENSQFLFEPAISIWHWEDAPQVMKTFSCHGGDEDWVAWVPAELFNDWVYDLLPRVICSCQETQFENGMLFISAHA